MATTASTRSKQHERYYSRGDPRRGAGRLVVGGLVGLATALALSTDHSLAVCAVAGWDAGAFAMLSLAWWVIVGSDQSDTQCRAAAADPGRTLAWLLVIMASTFSVFAGSYFMRHARSMEPERSSSLICLSLLAVVVAWSLTHTSYTLRYAHLYYRDDEEGEGGLTFPGDGHKPDDFDFAYFAFTIGMCFQVSDVAVTSSQIRRTVLFHALISFAYNTVILALALNLLFGFLS